MLPLVSFVYLVTWHRRISTARTMDWYAYVGVLRLVSIQTHAPVLKWLHCVLDVFQYVFLGVHILVEK